MAVDCRPEDLIELLGGYRFTTSGERELQEALWRVFEERELGPQREVILDTHARIDFLLPGGLGVEVKIQGSTSDVRRQVERYMAFEAIRSVVVITTKSKHLQLPRELGGKPLFVVCLDGSAF